MNNGITSPPNNHSASIGITNVKTYITVMQFISFILLFETLNLTRINITLQLHYISPASHGVPGLQREHFVALQFCG